MVGKRSEAEVAPPLSGALFKKRGRDLRRPSAAGTVAAHAH